VSERRVVLSHSIGNTDQDHLPPLRSQCMRKWRHFGSGTRHRESVSGRLMGNGVWSNSTICINLSNLQRLFGLGFGIWGSDFRVYVLGFGFRVQASGIRVHGLDVGMCYSVSRCVSVCFSANIATLEKHHFELQGHFSCL